MKNENLLHLINIKRIARDNITLLSRTDINYFIEPINNDSNCKFYRISREFQQILTSAGASIPNSNNPNFYKIIPFLNNLSNEYNDFDEYYIIENLLREVIWEKIMIK